MSETIDSVVLGSYIAFPPMGSGGSVVTVYAENRVNAERTLRSLNFLVRFLFSIVIRSIGLICRHRRTIGMQHL